MHHPKNHLPIPKKPIQQHKTLVATSCIVCTLGTVQEKGINYLCSITFCH